MFPACSVATAAASNLIEVFVDGNPVTVEPGTTVLQVTNQTMTSSDLIKSALFTVG